MRLKDVFKSYTLDQDKVVSPQETCLKAKTKLKQIGLNIFQKTERIDQGRLGIPVYVSFYGQEGKKITGKFFQMGKGVTPEQAEASAIMELVERFSYFSFKHNSGNFKTALYPKVRNALGLDMLAKSVDDQKNLERARSIFEKFPLRWTKGYNLTRQEEVWIPFDWFVAINEFNGSSAGNVLEEAIVQGLSEVVERHVCALIAKQKIFTPTVKTSFVKAQILKSLLDKYSQAGIKVYLKDFSLNTGIPTVGVVAYDPKVYSCSEAEPTVKDQVTSEIVFTAGTHTSPEKAAIRALTEAAQLAGDFLGSPGYVPSGLPKPNNLAEIDYLFKRDEIKCLSDLPDVSDANLKREIENMVSCLSRVDLEVLIVDLTHPLLNIPAVYVIVPGADFWQRAKGASLPLFLTKLAFEQFSGERQRFLLEELKTCFPDHYVVYFYQGRLYFEKGDYAKAKVRFEKALKCRPVEEDRAIILAYLGCCYKETGEYQKALAFFQQSLDCDPEQKEIYSFLGICYFHLGEYERAVDFFKKAIKLEPSSAIDYANIGLSLEKMGKGKEAVFFYKQALDLNPSLDFVRLNLRKMEEKYYAIR